MILMLYFYVYFQGSIFDIINKYGFLNEAVAGNYTRQMLQGLAFLHKNVIVHRDIKGECCTKELKK